jgi:hypothetical protein
VLHPWVGVTLLPQPAMRRIPIHFACAIVGMVLATVGTELERVSEVDLCLRFFKAARAGPMPPPPPPPAPPPRPPPPPSKPNAAGLSKRDAAPDLLQLLDDMDSGKTAQAWITWRSQDALVDGVVCKPVLTRLARQYNQVRNPMTALFRAYEHGSPPEHPPQPLTAVAAPPRRTPT